MKKKLLSIVLASAVVASLAACGSSSSDSSSSSSTTAASTAETTSDTSAAATTSAEAADTTEASGDALVLKWSEVNGDEYGATVGAKAFAEKINEISNGQIQIDLYENGTLGDEKTSMQGIQMGTLDIFRGNASSLPNYGASEIGLTGLPYLFQDMEQFEEMATSSLGQELLDSVAEEDPGYVAIGWLVEGPRSMFITEDTYKNLGNPTEFTIDMMKGLKIRVPETDLMVNTMDALGASATPIAYSELYSSLQSGVIDGAENGVTSYLSNSFNEVAPYFIQDAHTFGCGVILVSQQTWDSLSEEQQGWMREAATAASDACYEYNVEQEQAAFDSFDEKGVTLIPVSDLDKWQEACQSIYDSYSDEDQEIINRLRSGEYD